MQLADAYGNPITSLPSGEDYSIGIANADNAGNYGPYCDLVGPTSTTYCTWQVGAEGTLPVNFGYNGYGAVTSYWGTGGNSGTTQTGPDLGYWNQWSTSYNGNYFYRGYYAGSTADLGVGFLCASQNQQCGGSWNIMPPKYWTGTSWYTAFQQYSYPGYTDSYGDGGINYEVPSHVTAGFVAGEVSSAPPVPASSEPGSTVSFTERTFMPSQVHLTVKNPFFVNDNGVVIGSAYMANAAGTYCATVSQSNPYGVGLNVGIMDEQNYSSGNSMAVWDDYPGEGYVPNGGQAVVCGGSSQTVNYYPTKSPDNLVAVAAAPGESAFLPGATGSWASSALVWSSNSFTSWSISPYGSEYENPGTWSPVTFYVNAPTWAAGQSYPVSCYGYSGDQISCPGSVTINSSGQGSFTAQVYPGNPSNYPDVVVNVTIGSANSDEVMSDQMQFYN